MSKIFKIIIPCLMLFAISSFFSCKTKPEIVIEPEAEIQIIDPVFEVVSIIILQADLVVTEFETVLKVTNPNAFDVELISLTYQLFGNGLFWATGAASDILRIPAVSTGETRFKFSMNFINTNRRLFDDVLAMRPVRYRLKGEADVRPVIPNIKSFNMIYDIAGISEVKKR